MARRLTATENARIALVAAVAVTLLLYAVPWLRPVGRPLLLLSTLAHELGHGIAALLAGGGFHRLMLWPDGSGVAQWSGAGGRLELAVVAAGGLVGPAFGAAALLAAGRRPARAPTALGALAITLALATLLVVRTWFGWLFVGILVGLFGWVAARGSRETARLVLVFVALQLALSVFSRAGYLFTPVAVTGAGTFPSDVAQIAAALWLPWWFWGLVCGAISVAVLAAALRSYWR